MRNSVGNELYVTDGEGIIYLSKISQIKKETLSAHIKKSFRYKNSSEKIIFCIPKLKNPERLKFAIEKSVELGVTQFVIFESMYTISKTSNLIRLEKIAIAAMKQSLRAFLPKIEFDMLKNIITGKGNNFLFDQDARDFFKPAVKFQEPLFYIFGPEGGFDKTEIDSVPAENRFKLSDNRLRTETAVVKCASLLNLP